MRLNFKKLKRTVRRFFRNRSTYFSHIRITAQEEHCWLGNTYGGFFIAKNFINKNSIIYSIGVGEDISFDIDLIKMCNAKILCFDPTPKSIAWFSRLPKNLKRNIKFFPIGIAPKTGIFDLMLPKNSNNISGSIINQSSVNNLNKIKCQFKSLSDMMKDNKHAHIDLLKLDVEGAEYEVIESLLKTNVSVKQIVVEFHDRLFSKKMPRSKKTICLLKEHGYSIFAHSDLFEEVSFIRLP